MNFAWLKIVWDWLFVAIFACILIVYGRAQRSDGYAEAESIGKAALAELRLEHSQAETAQAKAAEASAKKAAKQLKEQQGHANKLAADLAEEQRKNRQTTDRLSGEIARVNDLYRDALDAQPKPLPACVFTAGWVRVYDEATGARVPEAADPGRAAAPTGETTAAEQLNSGISQTQLLGHHVHYAEQCRNTAAQLDLLIDQVAGQ